MKKLILVFVVSILSFSTFAHEKKINNEISQAQSIHLDLIGSKNR